MSAAKGAWPVTKQNLISGAARIMIWRWTWPLKKRYSVILRINRSPIRIIVLQAFSIGKRVHSWSRQRGPMVKWDALKSPMYSGYIHCSNTWFRFPEGGCSVSILPGTQGTPAGIDSPPMRSRTARTGCTGQRVGRPGTACVPSVIQLGSRKDLISRTTRIRPAGLKLMSAAKHAMVQVPAISPGRKSQPLPGHRWTTTGWLLIPVTMPNLVR